MEVHRSGFAEDDFYILWHKRRPTLVRIPFEDLGGPCELVCARGSGSIPLLKPILKLTALQKGWVPFHASAFEYSDKGVIAAGWTHGGKTSTLLAFAEHGARYVGDDVVFLRADGERMFGLSAPIGISDWQLEQLPRVRGLLPKRELRRVDGIRGLERLQTGLQAGGSYVHPPAKLLQRIVSPVKRRFGKVQAHPETLFGSNIRAVSEPRKLFLMISHQSSGIRIEPADAAEIAARMQHSMRHEGLSLMGSYLEYKFAFPGRRNERIEHAHEREAELLRPALAKTEAFVVYHPFPIPLGALHQAMRPFIEESRPVAAAPEQDGPR